MPIDLGSQRHLFEVPEDVAYFNTANMSPLLRAVREAGESGVARRAAPWLVAAADWFADVERLRRGYAGILCTGAEGVALIPATSYGLAVAARNVSATPGDQIVVLADEYPSNYYTWRRFCLRTGAELVVAQRERGATWTDAVLARLSERTRVLSVPNVHWTDGSLLDLEAVVPAARGAGAVVAIDASQSLGAMPLDVSRLRPDFVVSVGYKWLLGPFGLGCLYVDERFRDGEPLEENWINRAGSDDFAGLVDHTPSPPARRCLNSRRQLAQTPYRGEGRQPQPPERRASRPSSREEPTSGLVRHAVIDQTGPAIPAKGDGACEPKTTRRLPASGLRATRRTGRVVN